MRRRRLAVFALCASTLAFVASCSGGSEKKLLEDFFRASRVRDNVTLGNFATASFDPRTDGIVQARARKAALAAGIVCAATFALAGIWMAMGIDGFRILTMPDANSAFNPLSKTVEKAAGAWLTNYQTYPWMMAAPVAAFIGIALALWQGRAGRQFVAFFFSSVAVAGIILTAGFSMFPFVMPSATDPNSSLTLWDAASSHKTLGIMLLVTVVFLPLIMLYTGWVYRVMRGRVTVEAIQENTHTAY